MPQKCMFDTEYCLQGVFEYGGQSYDLTPNAEGASAAACERLVKLVLRQNEPCGAEQVQHDSVILCTVSASLERTVNVTH